MNADSRVETFEAEQEALRIRERNDAIYTKAIALWFKRTDKERPCQ